ncbi:hypothetical protein DBR28_12820 [Chryseobacterium sp. HMWF028]|nr:hypothetical protein DBR28_12820 [Chryseobacterium sp. HMWF028]
MNKTELSHCADSNNHLHGCLADVSVHLWPEAGNNLDFVNTKSADQNGIHLFYSKDSGRNLDFFNKTNTQLFFHRDIKLVAIWNKWSYSSLNYRENIFLAFEKTKKFYTNSIKLIDGFKFIIKIPDKPVYSSI